MSWAAARLGPELPRTLRQRLASMPVEARPPEVEPAAHLSALHAAGRLTTADKQGILTAGLRDVVAPCLVALLAARAS